MTHYAIYTNGTSVDGIGEGSTADEAKQAALADAAKRAECEKHELDGWTQECTARLYDRVAHYGGLGIAWEQDDDGLASLGDYHEGK